MSDIAERLRAWAAWDPPIGFDERRGHVAPPFVSSTEAADEIDRLRSLLKEAGEAIEQAALALEDVSEPDTAGGIIASNSRTVLSKIKGEA